MVHREYWTISECLRILRRGRAALFWFAALAGIGAAAVTYMQPRVYRSRAAIEVPAPNPDFLNLRTVQPVLSASGDFDLHTQAELAEQDAVLEEAARRLRLAERPEYQPASMTLAKLQDDVEIVPIKNTRVFEIVCGASEAGLAASLANTVAQVFLEQSAEAWRQEARQTYESIEAQIRRIRAEGPPPGEDRKLYQTLLERANDARTASAVSGTPLRLIAPAQPAPRPAKPNVPLNFVIGLLGGLLAAVGLTLLREGDAPSVGARGFPMAELGAIPDTPKPELPDSRLTEAFRGALTAILHAGAPRTLAVTSALAAEGKTTAACHLAHALAEAGRKTLLVGADSHRPAVHRVFGHANNAGFFDLLREECAAATIRTTAVANLYVLPSGVRPEDASRPPSQEGMARALERLQQDFEYVLVDAPACLEFTDARYAAAAAGGVILVVANHTSRRSVEFTASLLESEGGRVTGILLNRV
jgi:capsular exopolysaccharide synthesis family protein